MKSLREESPRAARRLDEVNEAFAPTAGEQVAAWTRLQAHWDGVRDPRAGGRARASGLRWLLGAGALAALGAIVWLVIPRHPAGDATALVATRPSLPVGSAPPTATTPAAAPRLVTPEPTPEAAHDPVAPESPTASVALRPGRSVLAAGVRARLAPRGAATVRAGTLPVPSVVSLQHGRLDIAIDAAPAHDAAATPRLDVQVAAYRIAADPGRFSVNARGGRVDVVVKSGKVAVWSSRRLLATVVAGQRWTNLAEGDGVRAGTSGDGVRAGTSDDGVRASTSDDGARAEAGAASEAPRVETTPAPPAEAPDCGRLTRQGEFDPALACFARGAARPGLGGELALIEIARIRRDVKGDLVGAEQALAEHRRRFPHGALADEAAGSRVELLLRLGRASEALDESAHLAGSDAIFWRAVCLSKLGRRAEAAQTFDEYLARPDGKRRTEATRRRAELAP